MEWRAAAAAELFIRHMGSGGSAAQETMQIALEDADGDASRVVCTILVQCAVSPTRE